MDPCDYVRGLTGDLRYALAGVLCEMRKLLYDRGRAGDTRDVAPDCRIRASAAGLDPDVATAVLLFWLGGRH